MGVNCLRAGHFTFLSRQERSFPILICHWNAEETVSNSGLATAVYFQMRLYPNALTVSSWSHDLSKYLLFCPWSWYKIRTCINKANRQKINSLFEQLSLSIDRKHFSLSILVFAQFQNLNLTIMRNWLSFYKICQQSICFHDFLASDKTNASDVCMNVHNCICIIRFLLYSETSLYNSNQQSVLLHVIICKLYRGEILSQKEHNGILIDLK